MNTFKKTISIISVFALLFTSVFSSSAAVFAETAADSTAAALQRVDEPGEGDDSLNQTGGENGGSSNTGEEAGSGEDSGSGDQGGSDIGEGDDIPDPEPLPTGAIKGDDGKWRYYELVETEEGTESVAKTGTKWVYENGKRVYYLKSGVLATGWQTINKVKYHFGSGKTYAPKMSVGYTLIGSTPYYFSTSTGSSTYGKMRTGAIKNSKGGLLYYAKSTGVLKTGWVAYDKHAYYMYKKADSSKGIRKGQRAYNYKVNRNITIGSSGRIGGTRGESLYYGIKALNKNGWSLYSAYKYSYKLRYKNRPYRPKTVAQGAVYGFSHHYGNCFVMNCCFHTMAMLMGYEVRQVRSSVGPWRAPHSWLEIKQDGKWWVYDANFRNETGRNGFKIYYGKRGTWRYNRSKNYLPKY